MCYFVRAAVLAFEVKRGGQGVFQLLSAWAGGDCARWSGPAVYCRVGISVSLVIGLQVQLFAAVIS